MSRRRKRARNLIWRHGKKYGWEYWRWFWREKGPRWAGFLALVVVVYSLTLISFWGTRVPPPEPVVAVSVSVVGFALIVGGALLFRWLFRWLVRWLVRKKYA